MVGHRDREPQPTVLAHLRADDALNDEERHLGVVGDQTEATHIAPGDRQILPHPIRTGARQDLLAGQELNRRTQCVADSTAEQTTTNTRGIEIDLSRGPSPTHRRLATQIHVAPLST